jgi:hypothetical protein
VRAETSAPVLIAEAPMPVPRPEAVAKAFAHFSATPGKKTAFQPPRANGVPDDFKLAMLIRTSLIALNQANLTGNYTVLRDLGSPAFHAANDPARLAGLFANLRARKINLEPILVVEPKVAEPFINERGMLRLKGFFPTQPEQVNFEFAFENVSGDWRIFGIVVTTSKVEPVASISANPAVARQ